MALRSFASASKRHRTAWRNSHEDARISDKDRRGDRIALRELAGAVLESELAGRSGRERKTGSVRISSRGRTREIACDYLACGFHLVPNTELAQMMGCRLNQGFRGSRRVSGDVAGERLLRRRANGNRRRGTFGDRRTDRGARGGGLSGCGETAFCFRARYRKVADAMKIAFRLRPELATLAKPETLLCRCEDVAFERVGSTNRGRPQSYTRDAAWAPARGESVEQRRRFCSGGMSSRRGLRFFLRDARV